MPETPASIAVGIWAKASDAWKTDRQFLPHLQGNAQKKGWEADSAEPSIYRLTDPRGASLFVPHPDCRPDDEAIRKWFNCSGSGATGHLREPASIDPTVDLAALGGQVIPAIIRKGRILFQ